MLRVILLLVAQLVLTALWTLLAVAYLKEGAWAAALGQFVVVLIGVYLVSRSWAEWRSLRTRRSS